MVALTINGQSHDVDVESEHPAALGDPRTGRPDRHEIRMRRSRNAAPARFMSTDKAVRSVLDAGQRRGRQEDHHDRRASRSAGKLTKVQEAWVAADVPQCGYCQCGMIMAVSALLAEKPKPTDKDIDETITNICRCGTFQQVREAIHAAANA
jgi:hypothetical protein